MLIGGRKKAWRYVLRHWQNPVKPCELVKHQKIKGLLVPSFVCVFENTDNEIF